MSRIPLTFCLSLALAACGTVAEKADESASSSAAEALTTVPVGPNKVYGIDVSHFQGTVNWPAEKGKGHLFGVASVGDGLYQDPSFATNWAAMKAAGVIRGAYQFFQPGIDPLQQADILIAKVGTLGDGDLPATIDVEVTGGQSPATVAARVGQWLARVEAGTGRRPMIYTGPYFWQDHVASTAYAGYPLWIADYGVTSPKVPAPWSTFKIWQYSDSGGTLDLDLFDGSLAELQAFARAPTTTTNTNTVPHGVLDTAACTGITGWAQGATAPTKAVDVHLWFDGAASAAGASMLPVVASQARTDLCVPLGSCNHGFTEPVPLGLRDGKPHQVFAYALDTPGGATAALVNAPKSFTCAPPEPPLAAPAGVKRHVASPAVLAAWKLTALTDVAHYEQTRVDAYASGADLPAAPDLIVGDDGAPEVWLVDGGKRRHVVSPASMTAWRFAAPVKTAAATIKAMSQGPDWRATPFLLQGTTPSIYALDLAPSTPPGTEDPGPHPNGSTNSPSGAPAPGDNAGTPPSDAGAPPSDAGGCSVVPAGSSSSAPFDSAALVVAVALALRLRPRARRGCQLRKMPVSRAVV